MNKCLVTKLMGAVSDETIPLLGYQQFAFSSSKKGKPKIRKQSQWQSQLQ